jgi:hypothetical protein
MTDTPYSRAWLTRGYAVIANSNDAAAGSLEFEAY